MGQGSFQRTMSKSVDRVVPSIIGSHKAHRTSMENQRRKNRRWLTLRPSSFHLRYVVNVADYSGY